MIHPSTLAAHRSLSCRFVYASAKTRRTMIRGRHYGYAAATSKRHSLDAHLAGRRDYEQLAYSASAGSTLYTFNVGDLMTLHCLSIFVTVEGVVASE
ncbi:MAG TPA: hypothetical protein VM943_09450 [Pyrinomonadaceae bacterium]|nr:hypothetical protein [Pyrinomonadaceae bacterium]